MTTCNDFELAIEQRLHGALDAAAEPGVAQHLAACAACRDFEASSRHLEEAMKTRATTVASEVDWSRIERGLARWKRQLLAGNWHGLVLLILLIPLLAMVFGDVTGGIVGGLVVVILGRIAARRAMNEARAIAGDTGALLFFLRRQLEKQIRTEKQNARVLPLIALLPLAGLLSHGLTPWAVIGTAMSMLLFVALALRSRYQVLPRLQRERAALD